MIILHILFAIVYSKHISEIGQNDLLLQFPTSISDFLLLPEGTGVALSMDKTNLIFTDGRVNVKLDVLADRFCRGHFICNRYNGIVYDIISGQKFLSKNNIDINGIHNSIDRLDREYSITNQSNTILYPYFIDEVVDMKILENTNIVILNQSYVLPSSVQQILKSPDKFTILPKLTGNVFTVLFSSPPASKLLIFEFFNYKRIVNTEIIHIDEFSGNEQVVDYIYAYHRVSDPFIIFKFQSKIVSFFLNIKSNIRMILPPKYLNNSNYISPYLSLTPFIEYISTNITDCKTLQIFTHSPKYETESTLACIGQNKVYMTKIQARVGYDVLPKFSFNYELCLTSCVISGVSVLLTTWVLLVRRRRQSC